MAPTSDIFQIVTKMAGVAKVLSKIVGAPRGVKDFLPDQSVIRARILGRTVEFQVCLNPRWMWTTATRQNDAPG